MRYNEFKTLPRLYEFAQGDFVIPEIDIIGPTDPATASINKQNALLLLQMDPDPSSMSEINKLLAQFSADSDANQEEPADQAATAPTQPTEPAQAATPVEPTPEPELGVDATDDAAEDEDEEQTLAEGKKAIDIGSRVAMLNENDPEQAELLAKIEAILESKKIEPVIAKIVNDKFTFHLDQIIETFKNAIISVKVSIQEKVAFLKSCKTGFFDMSSVKTSPVGNLYSGIPGAIFEAIKSPLFQIEFGTGGNKIGKGEALLAIIGKGAFKGEKGDIRINTPDGEEELEVKASSGDKDPTGAVLVALGKGTDAEGKRSKESAYGANTEAGKKFKVLIAKAYSTRTKPIKPDEVPNSVSSKSIDKFFNPFILRVPARATLTADAFIEAYKVIFKKEANNDEFFSGIYSAFSEDGIDVNQLTKVIRSMEFDYYKSVIKHDAILFMNGSTGTYRYIDSGASLYDQLSTSKKGANLYSTGVIDFTGSYGNGFGKIFTI
jgi:hypothetical protein